jgi:hypothetical protein
MKPKAIHNHILFQFVDGVNSRGEFREGQSLGGIELMGGFDTSIKTSRWGRIVSMGPGCSKELANSSKEILIENLKWTIGVRFGGETFWRTDEDQVLAYRDLVTTGA